jgi:1,4-dihydroxy-2-naphthoyl-CoA hydrolase
VDATNGLEGALARIRRGETVAAAEFGPFIDDAFGSGALGLVWDTFGPDRVTAHLDADRRHHQPNGIVHGGVWCAMVESLASVAAAVRLLGTDQVPVGVHNATDFLRSHRVGRILGEATPVHVGRTQQLWQVVLTRAEDGKAVARGQVRIAHVRDDQLPA